MALVVCSVIKALLTRLLFAAHCLLTIWRVVDVYQDKRYLLSLSALALLLAETLVTLVKRKGREWNWFCPSFFFYLLGVVPGIWFLELDRLERSRLVSTNGTELMVNSSTQATAEKLSAFEGFEIPVNLDPDMWVNTIEQTMLLLLIVGRWLLPKGNITRDQLSQLLFVYIGMASDIMELYYLFQEPMVLHDQFMGYVILGVWSMSLLQFCMVLTATKARKPRVVINRTSHKGATSSCCQADEYCSCCASEIWSILIMVVLQDAPFLTVRLYVTITYRLFSYNILFFTAKNALIILLQFYRVVVVCSEIRKQQREEMEESDISLRSQSLELQRHDKQLMVKNIRKDMSQEYKNQGHRIPPNSNGERAVH